jgi:isopenicillin-N epimerase
MMPPSSLDAVANDASPAPWVLDPSVTFLNHGSFGACPLDVLQAQRALQERMERQPVRFLSRELEELLDAARAALGAFLKADPDDLAFVSNTTSGVNTVLRSLAFAPGDELIVTDHAYNACRNALDYVAGCTGARVVVATVPFPVPAAEVVTAAVVGAVSARTRLALVDHVTSPTGLVFPLATIVRELAERGVDTLVDGAHAPGMVPLDLGRLGAAYYTGNAHKWLCAPKGSAFLWVRRDRQDGVRPLTISHGFNSRRDDRSRFRIEFDWTGTSDFTPFLTIPAALRSIEARAPGGWPAVMERNRALALEARRMLCAALDVPLPSPDDMIGALASVPLPDVATWTPGRRSDDHLQQALRDRFAIEVPVPLWPGPPRRLVRVSAQLYNRAEQYAGLAAALVALLGR